MEANFNIEVVAPDAKNKPFDPFVTFRFKQLNPTPHLMNDSEIDFQIDLLIEAAKKLRIQAKKKLKEAHLKTENLLNS